MAFGAAKALTNLAAGALAGRAGRKRLLVAGWLVALPVPLLIALAPSWGWIVAANLLLGVNQGLAWSMTVLMKIDLVGPARRGLALGLNESAGYLGVAAAALARRAGGELAPRTVVVVGALRSPPRARCSRSSSSATPPRTSPSSSASTGAAPAPAAARRLRPGQRTATRRFGPARRPGW